MCGVAGLLAAPGTPGLREHATAMAGVLAHRGPDDAGAWADPAAGIALGHRRLAVQDPTPDGAQPMCSASGRWRLSYNGELYSPDMARELTAGGVRLRGRSDTEVLVEALDRWGLRRTLPRLDGIFAFAAWDAGQRELWLVRDQFGIKPMYWSAGPAGVLFGSELRALSAHPAFDRTVDRSAVAQLLEHQSVPAPATVYAAARKLPMGHLLHARSGHEPVVEQWWDPVAVARAAQADPVRGSEQSALDDLELLVADAVEAQLVSDVPLGAFLSGGVDSSLVVALMTRRTAEPVRTFTIGFSDPRVDESGHAEAVARHLGTDHTTLRVGERELLAVVPRLAQMWDEPFADPSQVPTHLVSRLARDSVTVALSGDGGDELFGGYRTYAIAERAWRTVRRVPPSARAPLSGARAHSACDGVVGTALRGAPPAQRERVLRRAHRVVDLLGAASDTEVHQRLGRRWRGEPPVVGREARPGAAVSLQEGTALPFLERMMLADATTYLTDTVLTKVDRASMAVGLEVRVPLLDPRVFTAAWQLPPSMRVRGRTSKWALRQLLHRHVPAHLVDRPKQGFAVPLGDWLRGPLRPWAQDLLSPERLAGTDLFDTARVRQAWQEHQLGRSREDDLWPVLMFQSWHDEQYRP